MNDLNFEIGDTITSYDKRSKIFNRNCTVVHADMTIVGVITDGLPHVIFVPYNNLSLKLIKKGNGYLEKADKDKMRGVMAQWGFGEFIGELPKIMTQIRTNLGFQAEEKVYVKMDGFVPKDLGLAWKEFMAMMELLKQTNPEIPNFIATLFFEWVLTHGLTTLKFSTVFKQFLDNSGEGEQN